MDISLREIFDRARAAQEWVPPAEADLLFAAALRKAVEQGAPLSPARIILREGGFLELIMQDTGPEPEDYRAPELAIGDLQRPDARTEVYAAGAVGYELFTGLPPPRPPSGPGPELTGPLGDVVRMAMAHDRRERFADLQQLFDAVKMIEPHRAPPEERGLLAALLARIKRWEERAQNAAALAMLRHEHEQVVARLARQETITERLIIQANAGERFELLEASIQQVRAEAAAGLQRQQQNLRELVEDRRNDEARAREMEERREAHAALHPPRPPMLPVVGAAVAAAALASILTVTALDRLRPAPAPISAPAAPEAAAPAAPAAPAVAAPAAAPSAPAAAADVPDAGASAPTAAPAAPSAAPESARAAAAPAAIVSPEAPTAPARAPVAAAPAVIVDAQGAPVAAKSSPAAAVPPKRRALALLARGDNALEKGHADAAITAFHSALEADPELAEAHRGLGVAFAIQGHDEVAKLEYERYLGANPNASDASEIRAAINELNSRSKLDDSPR